MCDACCKQLAPSERRWVRVELPECYTPVTGVVCSEACERDYRARFAPEKSPGRFTG
jgi:hypothetical protein